MKADLQRDHRAEVQARFQQAVAIPMLGLAIAFAMMLALPYVADLSNPVLAALDALGWLIWAAFAFELAVNTYLAPKRLRYLRDHWFDVAIVVVPFLRPLSIVRSARVLRLLATAWRIGPTVRAVLTTHGLQHVLLAALVLVLTSATAATLLERGSGGSINSFPTAVWWAVTTVTTVGYGDTFPITAAGRGVGVFLMVLGISLFGVITASVAAFFVHTDEAATVTTAELLDEIRRLEAKVDEALASRNSGLPTDRTASK